MKNSVIIPSYFKFLFTLLFVLFLVPAISQSEDPTIDYQFRFETIKDPDQSRSLVVDFYGSIDRDRYPVYEADIHFYLITDDGSEKLGTAKTDKEGTANLTLPTDQEFVTDEDGYITFSAAFEGSENIDPFEEELYVQDLNLTMELIEDEDGRRIQVTARTIGEDGEETDIEFSDIYFYVEGMISNLVIEEGWIEEGYYEFEFPKDIPGDQDGNLTILAKIEDSDDFGTVVLKTNAQWGTGPLKASDQTHKLWTDLGPEWMITLLTIVLIAVWANIIHAIYNLVQIRKEGRVNPT